MNYDLLVGSLVIIFVVYIILKVLSYLFHKTEGYAELSEMQFSNQRDLNPAFTKDADEQNYPPVPSQTILSSNHQSPVQMGLNTGFCSTGCCAKQYGVDTPLDAMTPEGNYVLTNYTCNNSHQNTGCMCLTNDQADLFNSRGGNSSTRIL